MIYFFDLFGVAVFAVSGALVAGRKQMDLFGVLVLAVVTGIGGGTLRDLLLGATPVFWIGDPGYVVVAASVALATAVLGERFLPRERVLLVADAFGLALFSVLGAAKAIAYDTSPLIAVVMGVLTGVAGGALRDVLAREIPLVLQREIYATAAVLGAGTFVLLAELGFGVRVAGWTGLIAALALRLAAIRWHLSLPVFSLSERET